MHDGKFRTREQTTIANEAHDRVAECLDHAVGKPEPVQVELVETAMELDDHASHVTKQLPSVA